LPERLVLADNFVGLRRALRAQPVRPGTFSDQDIERYVSAAAQPDALRAALNYYRACFRANPLGASAQLPSHRPTNVGHLGEQDKYLTRELAEPDPAWVTNLQMERIAEASHWLQTDVSMRVNQLLITFLWPTHR
jgi:hypothetical protein